MAKKLKVISLYSGIGGIDFGFEAAGFDTSVAVEFDKTCCETMRLNRSWPVIENDIHDVTSKEILKKAKLKVREADVLIGGPPCQPFSKSSYWVKGDSDRLDDPRSGTLGAYLRVLNDTLPKAFLLENVPGMVFKGKDEGFKFLLKGIEEINKRRKTRYKVFWKVLNASNYGVPQQRERVFLIASRDGTPFDFPMITHGAQNKEQGDLFGEAKLKRLATAWDAFRGLPEPDSEHNLNVGGKWGDLLPTIPEGENYLWHTPRGKGKPLFGWRTRYWGFLLKLAKNQPSWTIQANPGSAIGPFHWESRKLSKEELCRLQTFPDGLKFNCGRTQIQKMLGNAVPSALAEILAREIKKQFFGARISNKPTLIPKLLDDIPAKQKVKSVPAKYFSRIGDHADHPGEGLGPRALQREI